MSPVVVAIIAVGVLGLLLGAMTVAMRRPARIRVRAVGDSVLVEPLGLDKVWCARGGVHFALSSVTGVRVMRRPDVPRPGLRLPGAYLPGAYLPGVIIAGSYGLGEHRTFWDVRRADRLLVIDRGAASGYRQLVLEVPDPDTTAGLLRQALRT